MTFVVNLIGFPRMGNLRRSDVEREYERSLRRSQERRRNQCYLASWLSIVVFTLLFVVFLFLLLFKVGVG